MNIKEQASANHKVIPFIVCQLALILSLFLYGCASSPPVYQQTQESLGTFSYGMDYASVQQELKNEGTPIFKAAYNDNAYLLVQAKYKVIQKSYIFVFRNQTLISIIDDKIFHASWQKLIDQSLLHGQYPFEDGLDTLYTDLVLQKDKIYQDNFIDVTLEESVKIRSDTRSTAAQAGDAVGIGMWAALAIGMSPAALVIYPLEKNTDKRVHAIIAKFDKIKLGDNRETIKKIFPKINFLENKLDYEIFFGPRRTYGLRNNKVEWISSYDNYDIKKAVALKANSKKELPNRSEMLASISNYSLPVQASKGQGVIYVIRPSFLGVLNSFDVYVDGKTQNHMVGSNGAKEYIYFTVSSGNHQIYSKANNWAELIISVEGEKSYFIHQQSAPGNGWGPNNEMTLLKKDEGTFFVKQLKQGKIFNR